jgi:hypothetical protein
MHKASWKRLIEICGAVCALSLGACGEQEDPDIMRGSSQDTSSHPGVYINEIDAANDGDDSDDYPDITDEAGNPVNWIELYNANDARVSLEGWSLTNNRSLPPEDRRLQDYEIPAQGVLLIRLLDEKPSADYARPYAVLNLTRGDELEEGNEVGLFDDVGYLVDCVDWEIFDQQYVLARIPDGGAWQMECEQRTPNELNGDTCGGGRSQDETIDICTTAPYSVDAGADGAPAE